MSWGLACHECDHRDGKDLPAYAYADSEGEAMEIRWEHIEDIGHEEIYIIGGCYYIGDGRRPRRLPGGDGDRYDPLDLDVRDSSLRLPKPQPTARARGYRDSTRDTEVVR